MDKWDLVDYNTAQEMKGLQFDQLGMIDFGVLMHAKYFLDMLGVHSLHKLDIIDTLLNLVI